MSFDVDIGLHSARGDRSRNEDFIAVGPSHASARADGLVAALADGVSTGNHGLLAAQTTVLSLVDDFFATPVTWEPSAALDRLLGAQNQWLHAHNQRQRRGKGAGDLALCTLTALVLRGHGFTLAHVGDSRAVLWRDGELRQLTHAHALEHPDLRHRLTRAVGLDEHLHVDYLSGELSIGDRFVLTSDGVHEALSNAALAKLLAADWPHAQALAEALVDAALAAGSRDNASAVVLVVRGVAEAQLDDYLAVASRLPAVRRLAPGERLDTYRIDAVVADNGVHRVYQAYDAVSGARVALKTLHEQRHSDRAEREMLVHEGWLGSALTRHGTPGFVPVSVPEQASALYLVFDWVDGQTLAQRLTQQRGGSQAPDAVATIVAGLAQIADALGRLHRLGIIHRDIKPDNLHQGADGQWRLLDLSVALSGHEPDVLRGLHAGTPSYMNPEQWAGDTPADRGSDLYALGVVAYQWLTGYLPYGEIEPWQRGAFRRDPRAPSRLRPDVPMWLEYLVLRAVALDPRHRFETAEELLLALERGQARSGDGSRAGGLPPTPLLARHPQALWQIGLGVSLLLNALLIYWLLFLPR